MTFDADVIIVGAGPAGSIAGRELALRGISVLILEKSDFPRYKVCGAGLTHKILEEIPYDISPVLETAIHTIRFSHGFKDVFERSAADPLIYCTMRGKFDGFMLQKAVQAGARVIHGEKVQEVLQDDHSVSVITRDKRFISKLVIGADGASGAVARSALLRDNIERGLAWEAELRTDAESLSRFAGTVFLDWGAFPGGYAWMFPKGNHISVGVGGPAALSKQMMPYYLKFMDYLAADMNILETLSLKSWPIPVRIAKSMFHKGRIMVAGDAGGLTDPMTGEGIYYAVRSGKMAAISCIGFLAGNPDAIAEYTVNVNRELMTELSEADRIKNVFNTFSSGIHGWIHESDRAWRAFGRILRGERNYADVRLGFGKWRFFWSTVTQVSRWIYSFREKQFAKNGFLTGRKKRLS